MRSLAAVPVFAALLGACGDGRSSPAVDGGSGDDGGVDARPEFMCWPSIAPIPRGTVELGKGGRAFSAIPDTLNIQYGPQNGFMVKVWTRMTGIDPGEAGTTVDYRNPATRVRATFVDSAAELQRTGGSICGDRGSYVESSAGQYDYYQELAVVFDTCWGNSRLVGQNVKITAELMDATGSYATGSAIITLAEILDDEPSHHNVPTAPDCGM